MLSYSLAELSGAGGFAAVGVAAFFLLRKRFRKKGAYDDFFGEIEEEEQLRRRLRRFRNLRKNL